MKTAAITIPHEELATSPRESWSADSFKATRQLRCAWKDRLALAEQLAGSRSADGSYQSPASYPHFSAARVASVSIEPVGPPADLAGDTQAAAYTHAVVTAAYATDVDVQALVSERIEPTSQSLTLGTSGLAWDAAPGDGGQPLNADEAPLHIVRGLDYVLTLHRAATIPQATLSLIGKTNASDVHATRLGLSFPAQTLLYTPPKLERIITTEGAQAWRIEYRLRYRPFSWNHAWHSAAADYRPLYSTHGLVALYPQADFTELFTAFAS